VMDELIRDAIAYAKRGCFVFPCKLDKTPMTPHGFKDATNNLEQIGKWWNAEPSASIGIACGATGWLVLDVDPDKGGFESFAELRDREILTPADLDTFTTRTGGGGMHIVWLRTAGQQRGQVGSRAGHTRRGRLHHCATVRASERQCVPD
jgi:hypothetical protein